jgi:hypothetical protein
MYLIGKEFNLNVDNKAVQLIFGNPKAKTCARIERWSLRLIPFKFKINQIPGISNIADYISRHATQEKMKGTDFVEEYINSIVDNNLPLNIRLDSIIQATQEDPILKKLKELLSNDYWDNDDKRLKPYFSIRSELSISSDDLILYGNRIIIPTKLQPDIIKIAHQSHQGKEKTKQLLNQFVWFKLKS